ncbi:MAG: ABC transporter ATP-binding protein [Clostridiaceae bacterium]|nr:ABC transporter ATP-binding protein/permease [Eubacteriales bacterium]
MRRIFSYFKPYLARMSVGLTIKFIGTIMDLLLPYVLAYTIDTIVPTKNTHRIVLFGGLMVVFAIVAVVTNIIANRMASRVARDTTERIRHDLYDRISYLSCAQADGFSIPSLESRLTSDTYNLHQMFGMMQRLGVRAPILLLGGILVTMTLEPMLSLILVAILPFVALIVYVVSKKSIPLYTALQQSVDKLTRTVRENTTGIRIIKALSQTRYEKARFSEVSGEVVANEKAAAKTVALTSPLMNLLLNLALVPVIVVGAYRVNAGLTQPGKIIAFLSYFTIILTAMLSITRMFVIYNRSFASALRIVKVLDAPEDLGISLESAKPAKEPWHIAFENVTFSYHKREPSIENIGFRLKRGETLGIIGATGSGKSTVLRLLMRLYDPDAGSIRIDGREINTYPLKELRSKFGVVFQDDILFADSIAENISFGRGLSKDDIERAVETAQAKEFVDSLPKRLDHALSIKSANLSGGQKQRLLIARAVAKKPEILILDDSSSALDYKTDALLRKALREELSHSTKIIVAQRVSSIRHAERILVLEDGKEAGYGTHEELMETCVSYREISISQMGGYAVGRTEQRA